MAEQLSEDTPVGARVSYTTKVRQADGSRRNVTREGVYTGDHGTRGSTRGGGRTTYYTVELEDGTHTQVANARVLYVPAEDVVPMTQGEREAAGETVLTVDTAPIPVVEPAVDEDGGEVPRLLAGVKRPERARALAETALQDLASGWRALDQLDALVPEGVLDGRRLGELRGLLDSLYPKLHRILAE